MSTPPGGGPDASFATIARPLVASMPPARGDHLDHGRLHEALPHRPRPRGLALRPPPAPHGPRARRHLRRRRRAVALRRRRARSCATRSRTPARSSRSRIDGDTAAPVLVKDLQRHPVRGEIVHVDFLRVNMNETIQTDGRRSSSSAPTRRPGVDRGRRALPGDARAQHRGAAGRHPGHDHARRLGDADERDAHAVDAVTAPAGVTLLDDPDETVIATITPPTLEPVERRSRPRPRSWARTASRPRPPRRRRGGRERRRRRPTRRRVLKLFGSDPGRLAGRRARQPRARLRRVRRTTSASRSPRRWRAAGICRKAEEEVRGRAGRGPHRPGRPARRACCSRRPT